MKDNTYLATTVFLALGIFFVAVIYHLDSHFYSHDVYRQQTVFSEVFYDTRGSFTKPAGWHEIKCYQDPAIVGHIESAWQVWTLLLAILLILVSVTSVFAVFLTAQKIRERSGERLKLVIVSLLRLSAIFFIALTLIASSIITYNSYTRECDIWSLSFSADTILKTAEGEKPIDQIEKGEMLLSGDGELVVVQEVTSYRTTEYFIINNELRVTAEHPFAIYVPPAGIEWRRAQDLRVDDILIGLLEEKVRVENTKFVSVQADPIMVYNLQVGAPHNYYVKLGEKFILVHNKSPIR